MEKAELVSFPLTLIVLLLVFGSAVAAGLPVLLALVSLVITIGLLYLLTMVTTLSIYVTNIPGTAKKWHSDCPAATPCTAPGPNSAASCSRATRVRFLGGLLVGATRTPLRRRRGGHRNPRSRGWTPGRLGGPGMGCW
jgi:hypothetical protein